MTKLGRINRKISYFTIGENDFVDSKNYRYKYKKVNKANDIVEAMGNLYDLLPKDNGSTLNCTEFSIIKDESYKTYRTKFVIRIFGEDKVIVKFYCNKVRIEQLISLNELRDYIYDNEELMFEKTDSFSFK